MAYSMTFTSGLQVGTSSENRVSGSLVSIVDGVIANNPDDNVPAAVAGTLSTRTGDTSGVVSVTAHSLVDTDTCTIFWASGARYGCDVDSHTSDTITFSGGAGDVLPAQTTAITISKPLEIDAVVDGDAIAGIAVSANKHILSVFKDAVPAAIVAKETAANQAWAWASGNGVASEFTGEALNTVQIYNADTTAAVVSVVIGYNNI